MQDSSITYIFAAEKDAPELAQLYAEFYPHLLWSEAYLKWQYFENPAGQARVLVAKIGNKIIATYAMVPHMMKIRGRLKTGFRIQDALTRPEYRGYGIYHAFSRRAKKELMIPDYPVNFTFPNDKSYNGFIKTGWQSVFKIPLRIVPNPQKIDLGDVSAKIEPLTQFNERTDQIWSSFLKSCCVDYAVERSAAYLNWRYLKRPGATYHPFVVHSKEDRLVIILKDYERENGERWAHICDLFQSNPNPPLTEAALVFAIRFASERKCRALSLWSLPGGPISEALKRYPNKEPKDFSRWFVLNVNPADEIVAPCVDAGRWHLSMGDSDVY